MREQNVAYGLIDGVQVELERMGFSLVERGTMRWTNPTNPQPVPPWNVLLVARKVGGQVEFEQVIESDESKMNTSDDRKRVRCNNLGKAFPGEPVSLSTNPPAGNPSPCWGWNLSSQSHHILKDGSRRVSDTFSSSAPNTQLAIVTSIIQATAFWPCKSTSNGPTSCPIPRREPMDSGGLRRDTVLISAFHWP